MRIRRCSIMVLEPREEISFELSLLLEGKDGLKRLSRWIALAPHLGEEREVDLEERELLGLVSPTAWVSSSSLPDSQQPTLERLLQAGLLIAESGSGQGAMFRERDEAMRSVHWYPLAGVLHAFTRWQDVDAVQNMIATGTETAVGLREKLGPPPAEAMQRASPDHRIALPRSVANDFDGLMARRATCRNFDSDKPLPKTLFAQLLERVFSAQAEVRVSEDTAFLKKNSPSGGGLHPMDAYLIVQHVEGVAPGLYHYQPVEHALEPLAPPPLPLAEFAMQAVAQQHWFANAHVLVLLVPRFDRTFWKYRAHAKGYRVVALEAGHLSQTLYLSATDAGLGAFITGAINETSLEKAFGLDPINSGVLAICGFGWRGQEMVTMELDPCGEIWGVARASARSFE